jgi:hypothetical protein
MMFLTYAQECGAGLIPGGRENFGHCMGLVPTQHHVAIVL